MPSVYLDTCAIQRPLDDLSQLRVRVESGAVQALISAVEAGEVTLVTSSVLRFESENNPDPVKLDFARRVLGLAVEDVGATASVRVRASSYEKEGIKPLDAAHLASAVEAGADYFCTADDALLRKAKRANTEAVRVVSPLDLIAALQP
ncbi:MAG: PIN domain-containing protein [Bacteroidota bacterium]